jgi:hypothetical protein
MTSVSNCVLWKQSPRQGKWSSLTSGFIYRKAKSIKIYFWVRTGMSAKRLSGPYFFEEALNEGAYLAMLWDWFVSRLERLGSLGHVWFSKTVPRLIMCSPRERIPERNVQRGVEWPWIEAFTGASGVAAWKSESVVILCDEHVGTPTVTLEQLATGSSTVCILRDSPCGSGGGVGSGAVRGESVLVGALKGCYWWKAVWRTRELHCYIQTENI